jgi:hypothetical protein
MKGTAPPNPAGRPLSARSRISEQLLADLAVVWETHGKEVLERLAKDDPGKLAQIAYGLLPRDVFISVEQRTPGNLDPDEWAIDSPQPQDCEMSRLTWLPICLLSPRQYLCLFQRFFAAEAEGDGAQEGDWRAC